MGHLIAVVGGLTALIVLHELGHFLVARWSGMRVDRFSIGFGPPLVSFQGRETEYRLALLPIGGFVQVSGWATRDEAVGVPIERTYYGRPMWQRVSMVAAGPAVNYLAAVMLFFVMLTTGNYIIPRGSTVITGVEGPAAAAGLKPGDVIVAAAPEGRELKPVETLSDIKKAFFRGQGKPVVVEVARPPEGADYPVTVEDWHIPNDNSAVAALARDTRAMRRVAAPGWPRLKLTVTPETQGTQIIMGMEPDWIRLEPRGFTEAVTVSFGQTNGYIASLARQLGKMITGDAPVDVGSVIKATELGVEEIKLGFMDRFLRFLALISVTLCLLNLLPLPALDGGRLMFLAIEAISRKPIPRKVELWVNGVGMLVLASLVTVVMLKDILSYL